MKTEFIHRDLIKIFPWISPRTLIYWVERGLLRPTFEDASGRGSSRKYSYKNLMEIASISELLRRGLPFAAIKRIIKSKEYGDIIENEKWDQIFWEEQEIVSAPVPMDKEPPYSTRCFSVNIHDFVKSKSAYLFGSPPKKKDKGYTYPIFGTSSIIMISFHGLNNFVQEQVKKLQSR